MCHAYIIFRKCLFVDFGKLWKVHTSLYRFSIKVGTLLTNLFALSYSWLLSLTLNLKALSMG